jgi:hypothetical protein
MRGTGSFLQPRREQVLELGERGVRTASPEACLHQANPGVEEVERGAETHGFGRRFHRLTIARWAAVSCAFAR